jgi:hypothetical protein
MSHRSWSAAAIAAVSGLLVAACASGGTTTSGASASGGTHNSASSGPDAAALSSQMVAAVKHAHSVHVSGSGLQGAQRATLDVVLTKAGGIGGTVSVGGHPAIAVRTSRGHAYILVSRALSKWQKIPPAACALMCGKWLKESRSGLRSLAGDAGWTQVIGGFEKPMPSGAVSYGGKATVNGQPALKLNLGDGTMYVAAQGAPYPLRIQSGGSNLTFSDWNTAKLPPPPPASKVITTGQLATGG